MQVRNKQDFWAGIMFFLLGVGFAIKATDYNMGTAARMGPGYFPFWLGVLMGIIGAAIALGATAPRATSTSVGKFDFKILFIIVGSVILFGVVLPKIGLILSLLMLVLLSSLASHEHDWKTSILNAIFLTILCWAAFIRGLGLVFPLWPEFKF